MKLAGIYGQVYFETEKALNIRVTHKECNGEDKVYMDNQYDLEVNIWIPKSQIFKKNMGKFVVNASYLKKVFIEKFVSRKNNYFKPLSFEVVEDNGVYKFKEEITHLIS